MERDGGRDQQQRIKDLFGFFSFLFSPRRRHGHHSTTIADVDGRDVNVSSNNRIKGTLRDGGMRQLATRLDGPTDRPTDGDEYGADDVRVIIQFLLLLLLYLPDAVLLFFRTTRTIVERVVVCYLMRCHLFNQSMQH